MPYAGNDDMGIAIVIPTGTAFAPLGHVLNVNDRVPLRVTSTGALLTAQSAAAESGLPALTAGLSSVTNAGTVAAGARSISLAVIGVGAATIAGVSVPQGIVINYLPMAGQAYGAVTYDATGTVLLISTTT
jgi:hypothetical protein